MTDEVVKSVLSEARRRLRQQAKLDSYRDDPVAFARDVLGVEPWSKQRDIIRSVQDNTHTAVKACHGAGKSFIAAVLTIWWVATRPVGQAIVVTTAPTAPQVSAILWEDIRKLHQTGKMRYEQGLSPMPMPGYITQDDDWKSDMGVRMAMGRKPADDNDHAFQGIHRRYVLVIVDESCGIKEKLWQGVESITTTSDSRVLAIGNPTDPSAPFKRFFSIPELWHSMGISSFDSPNFTVDHRGHYTDEDREKFECDNPVDCKLREWAKRYDRDAELPEWILPMLPNKTWVNERRVEWGEDSAIWSGKVLGEFPVTSENTLFSLQTMQTGWDRAIIPANTAHVVLGVDLSRFGSDNSAVYVNDSGKVRLVDSWGGKGDEVKLDGMESAERIHKLALDTGASEVRIDGEGVGGPILDQVVRLAEGAYGVVEMRGSAASPDLKRWANARAYWYDNVKDQMRNGNVDIDIKDERLSDELQAIQYHFKNRWGSLQIESKDDMRKRGMKSPDFSDAFVYAVAEVHIETIEPGKKFAVDAGKFLDFAFDSGWISPV